MAKTKEKKTETTTPITIDRGPGQPPFTPTQEQREIVANMVLMNIPKAIMAKVIGIARNTFKKAFNEEIRRAEIKMNATVIGRLYKKTEDDVRAQIFWLCNRDKENWNNSHMMPGNGNNGDAPRPIMLKITDESAKY